MDLGAYEDVRPRFMQRIVEMKRNRRISVGDHMIFIFENHDTVLFQIQEMLRTERITQEKGIEHELETYNALIPGPGELFATLLVAYEDRDMRQTMLTKLIGLSDHVALHIGEERTPAVFDVQPGETDDRLPAVNYMRFPVGAEAAAKLRDSAQPAQLVVTHPSYQKEADLPPNMRSVLADDLEGG
jgi:hypothetical protein